MFRYFMYRGYLLPHLKFHLLVGRMLMSWFCAFSVGNRYLPKTCRDLYRKSLQSQKILFFWQKIHSFFDFTDRKHILLLYYHVTKTANRQ